MREAASGFDAATAKRHDAAKQRPSPNNKEEKQWGYMLIEEHKTTNHQATMCAPAWVTPELLADTIETWQPYYTERLTVADSLAILLTISRLIDAVQHRTFLEN